MLFFAGVKMETSEFTTSHRLFLKVNITYFEQRNPLALPV